MPDRSTQFATFTVERDIAFPPAAVFRAFADIDAKRRWFGDPGGTDIEHALDFRVGGLEHSSGGSPEDVPSSAVPVFPATCTSGRAAEPPVPLLTTSTIIFRTSLAMPGSATTTSS